MLGQTYTFTTTAVQEAALSKIVASYNAANGTTYTNAQYLQNVVWAGMHASYQAQMNATNATTVGNAFNAATPATQSQVKTLLGLP